MRRRGGGAPAWQLAGLGADLLWLPDNATVRDGVGDPCDNAELVRYWDTHDASVYSATFEQATSGDRPTWYTDNGNIGNSQGSLSFGIGDWMLQNDHALGGNPHYTVLMVLYSTDSTGYALRNKDASTAGMTGIYRSSGNWRYYFDNANFDDVDESPWFDDDGPVIIAVAADANDGGSYNRNRKWLSADGRTLSGGGSHIDESNDHWPASTYLGNDNGDTLAMEVGALCLWSYEMNPTDLTEARDAAANDFGITIP